MSHTISLVFENNEYTIKLNEKTLNKAQDLDQAVEYFKQEIKNNAAHHPQAWEAMRERVQALAIDEVEIQDAYKTMNLGNLKYFNHTGKVFYMGQGKMIQLEGGFDFFYRVLHMMAEKHLEDSEALVGLCGAIIEKDAHYSLSEDSLTVTSAAFSYGAVGYQFANGKMNKGTASEKCSFDTFAKFVLASI